MTAPKRREPVERLAFSPAEVAQALGKSEGFIRELIRRGALPATSIDNTKPGKQRRVTWLINRAALLDLINGKS